MARYIYEVQGQLGPDGPLDYEASTSKMEAGFAARRMMEEGALRIIVTASVPVPRKFPDNVTATRENPQHLGGHLEGIARVLNGKWFKSRHTLIEFRADERGYMPGDVYSQVLTAKVKTDAQD